MLCLATLAPERCSLDAVHSWMSLGMVMSETVRPRKRRFDGLIHHVHDMGRTHHALVELRDVHVQLIEVHILLVMQPDEVVKRMACNREDWLPVAFCIVETIEQVNAPGPEVARQTPRRPVYFA